MISVIIPVYNVEKYLEECLDSVLRQSYQDFEVLLIDDGSKDGSGKICDAYASKDSRFSVIHKENGGVSSARFINNIDSLRSRKVSQNIYEILMDRNILLKRIRKTAFPKQHSAGTALPAGCIILAQNDNKVGQKLIKIRINALIIDVRLKPLLHLRNQYIVYQPTILAQAYIRIANQNSLIQLFQIIIGNDIITIHEGNVLAFRLFQSKESLYYYRANETSAMSNYRKNFLANQQAFLREFEDILRGLNLSDKRKTEDTISGQRAFFVAFLLWNEIRFRNQLEDFRGNIERIKRNEVYDYLTLKNIMKIKHVVKKIKALGLWLLIKAKLYKLM